MLLKINDVEIAAYPIQFKATVMDLDNGETTTRTADGMLSRDRIAVKRQIDMGWNALNGSDLASILSAMTDEFFDFTYPDPLTGAQATKTFYVGNREAAVAIERGGVTYWTGLQMTLIEQ